MKIFYRSISEIDSYCIFFCLLLLCNIHLLGFSPQWLHLMIFDIDGIIAGEYWRFITHLFLHISWTHFLMDCIAFILLWNMLPKDIFIRLHILFFSAAGSLLIAWKFSPFIASSGLCGLSGVDHGMMASVGIFLLYGKDKATGIVFVGMVLIKSIFETFFGTQIFQNVYFEQCGLVISHAHLGGVIGGIVITITIKITMKKSV